MRNAILGNDLKQSQTFAIFPAGQLIHSQETSSQSSSKQLRQLRKGLKKNIQLNGIQTHDLCDTEQCFPYWVTKPTRSWSRRRPKINPGSMWEAVTFWILRWTGRDRTVQTRALVLLGRKSDFHSAVEMFLWVEWKYSSSLHVTKSGDKRWRDGQLYPLNTDGFQAFCSNLTPPKINKKQKVEIRLWSQARATVPPTQTLCTASQSISTQKGTWPISESY